MTLDELVKGVAGQLGNTWRSGVFQSEAGQVPVIQSKELLLVFSESPDGPLLHIALLVPEGWPLSIDVGGDLGIGETAFQINTYLLAVYRQHQRSATDAAYAAKRNAELIPWHNQWCRQLSAWAAAHGLEVSFAMPTYRGVVTSLRAEFIERLASPPHRVRQWGVITLSPDGFPAKIEYFTTDASIRAQLNAAIPQPAAEPSARRRIFSRRHALSA